MSRKCLSSPSPINEALNDPLAVYRFTEDNTPLEDCVITVVIDHIGNKKFGIPLTVGIQPNSNGFLEIDFDANVLRTAFKREDYIDISLNNYVAEYRKDVKSLLIIDVDGQKNSGNKMSNKSLRREEVEKDIRYSARRSADQYTK